MDIYDGVFMIYVQDTESLIRSVAAIVIKLKNYCFKRCCGCYTIPAISC